MSHLHRGCFTLLICILQIGYVILDTNDLVDNRPIIHNKYRRQVAASTSLKDPRDDACKPFEEGDEDNHEFYSPGWPGTYPNYTECVRVLEAPKGHLLRLDFREFFNLEKSENCVFDFLEVRDGAHGYGQLLGQYCGKEFPPMITSTDRYLWLHFHSDENIEYSGFKAVYEFIERPTSSLKYIFSNYENNWNKFVSCWVSEDAEKYAESFASFTPEVEACRIHINGSEGLFSSLDVPQERKDLVDTYNIALDCMWIISVKEGWKIQLSFPSFKLDKPNDCDSNFVDVFSDRTDLPSRQKNYCGSIADAVTSKNNLLYVRFLAEKRAIHSKFQALFTAFREKKNNEACADDEYDCEDATCISMELKCNGRINCRFRWDEDECNTKTSGMLNSEHIIIIMVIFSLILSGMCFTFVFNCIKKLIRDHHTIQEHIRQSREQQLNVLGHEKDIDININDTVEVKKMLTDRSLSSSIHSNSSPSHKYHNANTNTTIATEIMPILMKGYNNESEVQCAQVCDSACQTRESLFDQTSPVPFNDFHYYEKEYDHSHSHSHSQSQSHSHPKKYKAEGKIHIEKVNIPDDKRVAPSPYSIQSTKSAPDVIVTH